MDGLLSVGGMSKREKEKNLTPVKDGDRSEFNMKTSHLYCDSLCAVVRDSSAFPPFCPLFVSNQLSLAYFSPHLPSDETIF